MKPYHHIIILLLLLFGGVAGYAQTPFNPDLPAEPLVPFDPDLPAEPNTEFDPTTPAEPQAQYRISLTCEPADCGAILSGDGLYNVGDTAYILTTTPSTYKFLYWALNNRRYSDDTAFIYRVTAQDVIFTAHFEQDTIFDPTTPAEPNAYTQIFADTIEGKYFVSWNDGNTDNPRWVPTAEKDNYYPIYADIECDTTYSTFDITAEGSYVWYGETYTQSGQYQHTIQNTAGCDSVITLNLIITPAEPQAQYRISLTCEPADCGAVLSGNGLYNVGDTAYILTTTPSSYKFLYWALNNRRYSYDTAFIYRVTAQDVIFTAHFEKDTIFDPTTPAEPNAYTQIFADTIEGKYFVSWNDGNTDNPRWVPTAEKDNYYPIYADIECDTTYSTFDITAEGSYVWFGETYTQSGQYQHTIQNVAGCDSIVTLNLTITCKPYSFDVYTNDSTKGTIEIIEEPSCDNDNLLILQAVANEHYHFVQWSDGNTDAKREIYLTHDLILNALFVEDIYQVNLSSNNPAYGRVTGSGSYAYGTEVVIAAIPGNRYEFVQWSDGNTDNPRTLIVTGDISLQAQFEELYFTITVESNDTSMGTVTGSGHYAALSTATIKAEAKTGYKFIMWNDGNRQAERSIIVVDNETYTAIFAEAITYHIEAVSANNAMGTVTGSGDYPVGAEAVLEAHPKENYQFIKWNDEVTDNPRTIIVTGDARYMAYFLVGSGLENNELHGVYVSGNQIFIDGHEEQTMQIYTITGQTIYSGAVKSQFTLLYNGVYLIRIGNQIAKIVI